MNQSRTPVRTIRQLAIILASYCLIAYLIHGAGYDITRVLLGGGDGYTFFFPAKMFANTLSPWNPYVQLGTYAFANTQAQPFYPPALIALALFPDIFGFNLFILGHYVLAGFFFFLYARNLPLNRYSSYFGGVCFMCGGFMLGHKGHDAMLSAAIWVPLILLFVDLYVKSGRLRDAAFGGVALALCILSGFPQITLYAVVLVICYFGYRCFSSGGPFKPQIRFFSAGLATLCFVGLLLSSLQLLCVAESFPYTSRQKISMEMFNQDPLPLASLGALVVPNVAGGLFGVPCYKPDSCGVGVYSYAGFIPLILAVAALVWFWRTRSDVIFWAGTILIAIILALALSPVQSLLYRVPVYNLFRAPSRHLFEVTFGISVLAAYGAELFSRGEMSRNMRALKVTIATVAVLLAGVLCYLQWEKYVLTHLSHPEFASFANFRPDGTYSIKDIAPRIVAGLDLLHPTSLYPILCFIASAAILWQIARHPMAKAWRCAAVAAVLVDVSLPYRTVYENRDASVLDQPGAAPDIDFMRHHGLDTTRDRVYPIDPGTDLIYPQLNLWPRIPVINDYGPMWSKRYQAITGFVSNGESETARFSPALMDVLSVKFLVTHDQRIAHQLRWISQGPPTSKSSLPLPTLNCVALSCTNARFSESGVITLGAPEHGLSFIQVPFEAERNTIYDISFDGRALSESIGPFHIDFSSTRPEWEGFGGGQRRSIISFGPDFTNISVLIESGHTSAKQGYVRLFTSSPGPYEIRNLAIAKSGRLATAYKEVFGAPDGNIVFENVGALPRFRFASRLVPASSVADAREIIMSSSFDPASQVTVEGLSKPMSVDSGTILSQQIENTSLTWQIETGPSAFFVVADSWFPGWTATIDGHTEPIKIVDGLLRGVFIKGAGRHLIQMEFHPRTIRYGFAGTIAGGLLVAGITIVSAVRKQTCAT
jgi:hypothetical protein